MPKAKHTKTGKKQDQRIPFNPKGVTELTEQALEQVHGGVPPGPNVIKASAIPPGPNV